MGGEIVLIPRETIPNSDHLLTVGLEENDFARQFLQLAQARATHPIQLQYQRLDSIVILRFSYNLDEILE